ncbi:MAG TPA: SRPBCC domain-containing protein [Candidatus Eisenbacteria bacterium]|nr:SRPBCC domain-containing protein [Candidatus Eisenbacteria bacterium]
MANPSPERLVVERVLPAAPAEVYAAWTTPETLRMFMCPGDMSAPIVEADVRVGGNFRIVMRGERETEHRGEYRVLEPGRRLVFTWASPSTGWVPTLVTIELSPHEDGTRLVLVHEGLATDDIRGRHRQGWTSIVEKLAHYIERKEKA